MLRDVPTATSISVARATRAFLLLLGTLKRACGGVFIGENAHPDQTIGSQTGNERVAPAVTPIAVGASNAICSVLNHNGVFYQVMYVFEMDADMTLKQLSTVPLSGAEMSIALIPR
jgi:H+/gluconate symporter-like permease